MPTEAEVIDLYATLDGMELDELRQVQKRVGGMISDYQDRKRREAIAAAEQVAKEHGFKLAELVGGRRGGKAKATDEGSSAGRVAAYVNPDNPEQVWGGRGRRPGWVRDALAAGRTLDDLAA